MEYLAVKTMNTETPDCPALRGQNIQNKKEGRQSQMDKENFKQYFVCNPHRMGLLAANCFCAVLHGLKVFSCDSSSICDNVRRSVCLSDGLSAMSFKVRQNTMH